MRNMRWLSVLLVLISFVFFSCLGMGDQAVFIDAIGESDRAALVEVEELILESMIILRQSDGSLETEGSAALLLADANAAIESMKLHETVNKIFAARLLGLDSWIKQLNGVDLGVPDLIDEIASLTRSEEFLFIFKAMEEDSPVLMVNHYTEASEKAFTRRISSLLMMDALLQAKEYDRAAVLIDEMVLSFPEFSHAYLIGQREVAVALAKALSGEYDAFEGGIDKASLILKGSVTIFEMIQYIHQSSDYFLKFSLNRKEPVDSLFSKLKGAKYFFSGVELDAVATRRDVAVLFMNIISDQEKNVELKTKYSDMFPIGSGMVSPVEDISVEDEAFNAILLVVEKAVMDLPNGIVFEPDRAITSNNFFSRVDYLKKIY